MNLSYLLHCYEIIAESNNESQLRKPRTNSLDFGMKYHKMILYKQKNLDVSQVRHRDELLKLIKH